MMMMRRRRRRNEVVMGISKESEIVNVSTHH